MPDQASSGYSTTPSYDYMPALDGLRAVAILLVLLSHFGLDNLVPGGFGVTVFFFISGFLISRQLTCEITAKSKISYFDFYMRRIARLLPALLVMILLSAALFLSFGGKLSGIEVLSAVFYMANYYDLYAMYDSNIPGMHHPFPILWSLSVEEHFYIIFPVLFAILYPKNRYISALIALLAAALLWRLYLWNVCSLHGCGMRGNFRFYKATDTRFDSILYGVLLTALLAQDRLKRLSHFLSGNCVFILSLCILASTFLIRSDAFRETWRYSMQGIALLSIITVLLFSEKWAGPRKLLSYAPLLLIGRWSYSLYLYHWVGLMIGDELTRLQHTAIALPAAIAATIILSLLSYYLVERSAMKWRKQFGSHAG